MSRFSALIRAWQARRHAHQCGPHVIIVPPEPEDDYSPQLAHSDWSRLRNLAATEYPDLASAGMRSIVGGHRSVFITARFRSGSTMLWNLLRNTPGVTAYYEPLHATLSRPSEQWPGVDPTHDDVQEYWSEYRHIPGLADLYTQPWHRRNLYLDRLSWQPELARYIQTLIDAADGVPVLQFNRVDFRLEWLRHTFPDAHVIHLFRNPRDQWLSVLRDPASFGPHDANDDFAAHDLYFMNEWVEDLSTQFPLLDWDDVEHPYEMFYRLWKLSYVWGKSYSHLSLSYEQLLTEPRGTIGRLFDQLGWDQQVAAQIAHLVHAKGIGKWRRYADADWFAAHESRAESRLDAFLGRRDVVAQRALRAAG